MPPTLLRKLGATELATLERWTMLHEQHRQPGLVDNDCYRDPIAAR